MRALTWHGKRDVRIDTVSDPKVVDPTDIIANVQRWVPDILPRPPN
ncbi:hypothetical protein WKI65_42825 [Streptomyces sp. MS1.AVA.3]